MSNIVITFMTLIFAENDNFVRIVDICLDQCLLLQRTSIYYVNVSELCDRAPDHWIDLVANASFRLSGNDHNFL